MNICLLAAGQVSSLLAANWSGAVQQTPGHLLQIHRLLRLRPERVPAGGHPGQLLPQREAVPVHGLAGGVCAFLWLRAHRPHWAGPEVAEELWRQTCHRPLQVSHIPQRLCTQGPSSLSLCHGVVGGVVALGPTLQ